MKRYLLLASLAACLYGQPRNTNSYSAACVLTLTGTAKACTIQQPASNARNVQLVSIYVKSTVNVDLTQERNGTAASSTAATTYKINPENQDAARATVWTDSNVGVGSLIFPAGTVSAYANSPITIKVEDVQMRGSNTAYNYTMRTSGVTGTVTIAFFWREF